MLWRPVQGPVRSPRNRPGGVLSAVWSPRVELQARSIDQGTGTFSRGHLLASDVSPGHTHGTDSSSDECHQQQAIGTSLMLACLLPAEASDCSVLHQEEECSGTATKATRNALKQGETPRKPSTPKNKPHNSSKPEVKMLKFRVRSPFIVRQQRSTGASRSQPEQSNALMTRDRPTMPTVSQLSVDGSCVCVSPSASPSHHAHRHARAASSDALDRAGEREREGGRAAQERKKKKLSGFSGAQ